MSGTAGIALASRKMSATAIGWVSGGAVAAARAVATACWVVAASASSSEASARFGATSMNQKPSV